MFSIPPWLVLFSLLTVVRGTSGVARTPPMGFNTWNKFGCSGISAKVLMDTADQFVSLGLKNAGYTFVNSDDCWMLENRSDNGFGPQIPNPDKFPDGIRPVVEHVNKLGLKLGLYTARAPQTCAGYAASCNHELIDAKQWADWGVSYMKDDSCGSCSDVVSDYERMQMAIDAANASILLTIEGQPDINVVYQGGYGNARRVGHDIGPFWLSMASLIDIGSGLHKFAHNDTGSGGFWNDLDMLEVGNGDFIAEHSEESLNMARAHFSMWAIMKAVMLLGNNLTAIGNETLAVVKNAEVIAINQDPWGIQAQRISSTSPRNTSLSEPNHAVLLMAKCDDNNQLQKWRAAPRNPLAVPNLLVIAECNSSDAAQRWQPVGSASKPAPLQSMMTKQCVDSVASHGFTGKLAPCNAGHPEQLWGLDKYSHMKNGAGHCLDVYDFSGPNVFMGGCKSPLADSNQVFRYNATTHQLVSGLSQQKKFAGKDACLAVSNGGDGHFLYTTDSGGQKWCAGQVKGGNEGGWLAKKCTPTADQIPESNFGFSFSPSLKAGNQSYEKICVEESRNSCLSWSNQYGASGPLPHTRYVVGHTGSFFFDSTAAEGSVLQATDTANIIDDNNVGHVGKGGAFCMELSHGAMLETWAGPLSGWRYAVALFNRSPSPDTIDVQFARLPLWSKAGSPKAYRIRDVWAGKDAGTVTGQYSATVPAHAVVMLILTPA